MDFNIIFWTVIVLLTGFSTTTSQNASNMASADCNNTDSTTTCVTPDTSTATALTSTGSSKSTTSNDSNIYKELNVTYTTGNGTAYEQTLGQRILHFILNHWLYFDVGGGCLILVIISLCVICCSYRRRDLSGKHCCFAVGKEVAREQTSYDIVNYTTNADGHTYCDIQKSKNRESNQAILEQPRFA